MSIQILTGDCRELLKTLPDESVQCVVTSPPYYGLRDYGVVGQMGLEQTPDEYVSGMVKVFHEVRRVLRSDGTLWLNLGDSYAGSGKGGGGSYGPERPGWETSKSKRGVKRFGGGNLPATNGLKPKDLIGIPWRVAFALQADGWYLRQDIIWAKPNPMPESVRDRCTKSHEYVFLMSKSPRYYFDGKAIAEPVAASTIKRLAQDRANQQGSDRVPGKTNGRMKAVRSAYSFARTTATEGKPGLPKQHRMDREPVEYLADKRNKRDVWTISTKPYRDAHFAVFPPELAEPCILAGSKPGDVVLDPFAGAGTTGLVAKKHGRDAILMELNLNYVKIAEARIANASK